MSNGTFFIETFTKNPEKEHTIYQMIFHPSGKLSNFKTVSIDPQDEPDQWKYTYCKKRPCGKRFYRKEDDVLYWDFETEPQPYEGEEINFRLFVVDWK